MYFCYLSIFLMQPKIENLSIKKLKAKNWAHQNTPRKNFWTHEVPTRKNFRSTKYPHTKVSKLQPEKIWDPRKTHERKFLDLRNTRRYDGTMKLDPQNPRWHITQKDLACTLWSCRNDSLCRIFKCFEISRSSQSQIFLKIGVLNDFTILTGKKHLGWSLFWFPVNIAKSLRTAPFIEQLRWLLLDLIEYDY